MKILHNHHAIGKRRADREDRVSDGVLNIHHRYHELLAVPVLARVCLAITGYVASHEYFYG